MNFSFTLEFPLLLLNILLLSTEISLAILIRFKSFSQEWTCSFTFSTGFIKWQKQNKTNKIEEKIKLKNQLKNINKNMYQGTGILGYLIAYFYKTWKFK